MEGDDDLSQLLFRLRLFYRVAQLPLFLISGAACANDFELQEFQLIECELMSFIVGIHEDDAGIREGRLRLNGGHEAVPDESTATNLLIGLCSSHMKAPKKEPSSCLSTRGFCYLASLLISVGVVIDLADSACCEVMS